MSQVAVVQEAIGFRRAPPRSEVNLVDADRRVKRLRLLAPANPPLILPLVVGKLPDYRRRARAQLRGETDGIGLFEPLRRDLRLDAVLVDRALVEPGHEAFPDPRRLTRLQGRRFRIPVVEVADQADRVSIRRPHREEHAARTIDLGDVRTELLVDANVSP